VADYELIPLRQIREDPDQPRRLINEEAIAEMAATMRTVGVIEPLVVRPDGDKFTLIVGHRRRMAAEHAGLKRVPCIVRRDIDDLEVMRIQAVEDVQNEELDPRDRYDFWARLWEAERKANPKMTMNRFARDVLGMSSTYVSAGIEVAEHAPPELRELLGKPEEGQLHPTYARYLVKDRSLSDQERVAVGRKIAAGDLPAGGGKIGTETLKTIRAAPPRVRKRLIEEPGYTLELARWEIRGEDRKQAVEKARRERTITPGQLAFKLLRATLDYHTKVDPRMAPFIPNAGWKELEHRIGNLQQRLEDFRLARYEETQADEELLDAIDAAALQALLEQETEEADQ
jgi:ParB family chromosome partitioning protein